MPLAFELVGGGWRGATTFDGSAQACERDVAIHLGALRVVSAANPTWRIRIEIELDGGEPELQAGSFGEDSEEVESLLRWTSEPAGHFDSAHTRLYASVRLPPDAYRHFLDLVVTQLPESWPAPTTDDRRLSGRDRDRLRARPNRSLNPNHPTLATEFPSNYVEIRGIEPLTS